MMRSNIWGAFSALGFEFETRREPDWLLFDEEKLRGSAGLQELWSVAFPLDQLSGRRPNVRSGWMNKPE
jgi:hypothetical protein